VIVSGLTGSRLESYQYICEFLRLGWQSLGFSLRYGEATPIAATNPSCFSLATGADLVLAGGYKLIGSAQLRRKQGQQQVILQHGSMRLKPDRDLFTQIFGPDSSCLSQEPPQLPGADEVMASLIVSAKAWFGVELVPESLSVEELQMALSGLTPLE
jgi:lipoate-protein ligase A